MFQILSETNKNFIYFKGILLLFGGIMHKTEYDILELFRKEPGSEYSTSDIVKNVEKGYYSQIEAVFKEKFIEPEKIKSAKRMKAQLHRKILYYLSKLVQENVLKVTREGKKGEKFFSLAIEAGEEITIDRFKRRSITIVKPKTPAIPIEGYEQRGIIYKLEAATWIDRLNSILIECSMIKDLNKLNRVINTCFSNINDTICLNDFETIVHNNPDKIISFVSRLNNRCSDYGKKISCVLDATNFKNDYDILKVINEYTLSNLNNISFIFDVQPREFQDRYEFFEKIIDLFSKHNINLYIKNQNIHKAPYILGRAGPYTFDEEEWQLYKKELQGNIYGLVCAQATVMVDMERFFNDASTDIESFKIFIAKIMESFLTTNSLQRGKSDEYFENLIKLLEKQHIRDFFVFSKNYIRFWNYGWKRLNFDQDYLIDFFKEAKNMVDKFCISEETIYKSCGMPTRFRIAFSCAFEEFIKDIFSKPRYSKFYINDIKAFYKNEIKNTLDTKEKLFRIFDGGDLITFYRGGNFDAKNIMREISFILNSYKLPFFRYNFGTMRETNLSLARFFE
jgi:hypothetical protein